MPLAILDVGRKASSLFVLTTPILPLIFSEITLEPGCTTSGTPVQKCTVCSEILSSQELPATGHTPGEMMVSLEASCLQSGLKEKKCSTCGAVLENEQLPAPGHNYTVWEITSEATRETEGEQRRHCIHCGDTQFQTMPKIEKFLGIF